MGAGWDYRVGDWCRHTRHTTPCRIGLPAVRAYRRRRLEQAHQERMATLDAVETSFPDLNTIMMLRVGAGFVSRCGTVGGA